MQPVFAAFITQVIRVGEEATFVKVEYFFLGEGAELDESAAEVDEVFHGGVFLWGSRLRADLRLEQATSPPVFVELVFFAC